MAKTDMATFACTEECDDLCKSPLKQRSLFKLSDLYPGLTTAERALAASKPNDMFKAYTLTWKAEALCEQIYSQSKTNDESDACRHFIWAALLYRDLGSDFSAKVLNAHEVDPDEPEEERALDLANNRLGLVVAEQLEQKKLLTEESILNSFKENLAKNNFVVLEKSALGGGKK